jgi:hypothetical protein
MLVISRNPQVYPVLPNYADFFFFVKNHLSFATPSEKFPLEAAQALQKKTLKGLFMRFACLGSQKSGRSDKKIKKLKFNVCTEHTIAEPCGLQILAKK